tara:strand:- start:357 stop:1322 length:966 start_codon:yes stop_codon:yes gene_type:complete
MKDVMFSMHEDIARNILFVDGIPSAGKGVITDIVHSLDNMEKINIFLLFEWLIPGLSLGTLDVGYAKAVLRIALNELAYNNMIGRNSNFRYTDHTGIHNYKDPLTYYKRLLNEEGDTVVEELKKSNSFLPFRTHDLLVNLEYLDKLEINYLMIEVFRHPVDIVHSIVERGWGERFGVDPRAFTLTIEHKGQNVPWYVAGYEEQWLNLNSADRCLKVVLDLIARSINQTKKRLNKNNILFIKYEDFVENTDDNINKICSFLKTEPTIYTPHFKRLAGCPRVLDQEERNRKAKEIRLAVNDDLYGNLMEKSKDYENNCFGISE